MEYLKTRFVMTTSLSLSEKLNKRLLMPKKTKGLARIGGMVTIFLLLTCITYAQNAVTGKVINKTDNTPVPGATVQVKGTKVISQSGADGTFSINLPGTKGTLVISAVGFGS